MKLNCPYCESLDVAELLSPQAASKNTAYLKRLIRYYCNNPHTLNNYCSCKGIKSECPHVLRSTAV